MSIINALDTTRQSAPEEQGFVVIVARNNLALTKRAVNSALNQDMELDVCVIDNESTDGTANWISTKPVVCMFEMQQQSLATCWNSGLQLAWKIGRKHALVINNDVELRPTMYSDLLNHGGLFVTGQSSPFWPIPTPALPIVSSAGPDFSCFMIRKEVTDRIGYFDERFFPAYCEDCDYHVRMHRAGIEAVSINRPFLHQRSATLMNCNKTEMFRINRGADRNRELFAEMYGCKPGEAGYAKLFDPLPTVATVLASDDSKSTS